MSLIFKMLNMLCHYICEVMWQYSKAVYAHRLTLNFSQP